MECRHIFSDGKRCRCAAVPTHVFCRHHAPQPRPRTLRPRGAGLLSWRDIRIHLATLSRDEVPSAILTLLSALLEDGSRSPSDRNAGALLRALVRRFGSVPFSLPTDPAPEPDATLELARSLDRICAIIGRNQRRQVCSAPRAAQLPHPPTQHFSPRRLSTQPPWINSSRISGPPACFSKKGRSPDSK